MKKITLIIALIFTTQLFSQYDLQFSKVITMVLGNGQEATVPEGKVWKVESAFSGSINNNYMDVRIDNSEFGSGTNVNSQFGLPGIWNSPLWLKAGDRVQGESAGASYSIIEFTLVTAGTSGGGGSDGSGGGDSGSGGSGSGSSSGVSFNDNSGVPGDDFTDLDGNVYGTTNINGMIWTTSNYEGTTYSDGTPIPYISNFEDWRTATTGAYTYLYQDATAGYGKLYNLHAIRGRHDEDPSTPNKQFAPDGWHVPSFQEFEYVLNLYDDDPFVNSFSLKSTTGWFGEVNGTNISGINIKGYSPVRYLSDGMENWEFYSSSELPDNYQTNYAFSKYTELWTSTPCAGSNSNICNNMVRFSTYSGQYQTNAHAYSTIGYFNNGLYVRLVKDY